MRVPSAGEELLGARAGPGAAPGFTDPDRQPATPDPELPWPRAPFAGLPCAGITLSLHSGCKSALVSAPRDIQLMINFFVLPRTCCPVLSMCFANMT